MALIKDYITGQTHIITTELLKQVVQSGEILPVKGQGLEIIDSSDIPDFTLRVVSNRKEDLVVFLPKHDDAKRWYRNWFAVRAMKLTGKDMPWGREYVRQARGVSFANEDEVMVLTGEFDSKLPLDHYHTARNSSAPSEYLAEIGFKIETSALRVKSALEMIGKIWAL